MRTHYEDTVVFGKIRSPHHDGIQTSMRTCIMNNRAVFAESLLCVLTERAEAEPAAHLATRACDLADALYQEFGDRGWAYRVPDDILPEDSV